jgi:hypothetical protein
MFELIKTWSPEVSLVSAVITAMALYITIKISRRQDAIQAALAELQIEEKLGVINVRCRTIETGDPRSDDYNDAVLFLCGDTCALLAVHSLVAHRNKGEYAATLREARRLLKLAAERNPTFRVQLTKVDDEASEKGVRLKDAF